MTSSDRVRRDVFRSRLTKGADEAAAFNVLLKILREKMLRGGTGFIKGAHKCVCFSESPLSALAILMENRANTAVQYQPIGLSFSKEYVYARGGRPVIYQHVDEYETLPDCLKYRHVSYDPLRRPKPVDVTWEREWRIKVDEFAFQAAEVAVILPTRIMADELRKIHFEAWKAAGAGDENSDPMPWHLIVLEDLGVRIDFPRLIISTQQPHTGGPTDSVAFHAMNPIGASVVLNVAPPTSTEGLTINLSRDM